MRVIIRAEEKYPVYGMEEPYEDFIPTLSADIYSIPEELYQKWQKVFDDFSTVQGEIIDFIRTHKGEG